MKVNQEKTVETTYDLSAEWNDPSVDYEMQKIQCIINSIVLSAKQVKDPVKKWKSAWVVSLEVSPRIL